MRMCLRSQGLPILSAIGGPIESETDSAASFQAHPQARPSVLQNANFGRVMPHDAARFRIHTRTFDGWGWTKTFEFAE